MPPPNRLFDRDAVLRHRHRAFGQTPVTFLHDEAITEMQEKLIDVNRAFTDIAIVTGMPGIWAESFPQALVVGDDETLGLESASRDLIIHAMSLHAANDPVGQLIQMRRALRPDGLMIAVCFGGQTLQELRAALAEAETGLCGGLSPRISPMAEIRDLGALLQRAGFALPVADSSVKTVSYASMRDLMHDLRGMGETNALTDRLRKIPPRDLFDAAERIYKNAFADTDGRIPATFEMIYLTGWAPDESQPKPLRPGSATNRLADFLNTAELGEDAKPVAGIKGTKK